MLTFFKKTVIALIFFLFFNGQVKAQWVAIPDVPFAIWLQQNYPTCMNGNLMDTTCSEIVNENFIHYSNTMQNATGIQYFDSLDSLELWGTFNLTSLPNLPSGLTYLSVFQGYLTSLPTLPSGLTYLQCGLNNLTSLPSLPQSIIFLDCMGNQLSSLPPLPTALKELRAYGNNLTSLPALPNNLLVLWCWDNQLTTIPALPNALFNLQVGENSLTSLPSLPNSLTNLVCNDCQLTSLPALPSSLDHLLCYNNQLTVLPALPDSLLGLNCSYNQLTNLPTLPSIFFHDLQCGNNQLTELPDLPPSITELKCENNLIECFPKLPPNILLPYYLNISNNPFFCLPNYVPAMNGTGYLSYPLCSENDSINNPNGCISFKGVYGSTFNDINNDCNFDSLEVGVPNITVQLFDSSNTLLSTFYTLNNGVYNYILDTAIYTVKVDTINKPYTVSCLYPGIDSTLTLTASNPLAKNINFSIACKPSFDIGVKSVSTHRRVFPGMPHEIKIAAGDLSQWYNLHCASGISGNVVVTVNGPVTFDSIPAGALTPTTITGNTFTYTIADFGALNLNSFSMWFTTDTSAQSGDQICVNVNVTPTIGDIDTTNNTYTFCYTVINSYDPNDKQVYPTTVNPSYNRYFTYTINFQNVGTAAAQNIRVVDTLDSNLDLSTFEIINYSHANTSTLTGNIATFRFPNIQLADSASNPEGSKGFMQYRIKPVVNLPFGTQIENKADIYFDFNSPITTNTAVSTFNSTVGVSTNPSAQEMGVMVYPNPGKGVFNVIFSDNSSSTKTIEVFNLIGEKVFSATTKTVNSVIDLASETNGVYVLRVSDSTAVYTQRLTKQ